MCSRSRPRSQGCGKPLPFRYAVAAMYGWGTIRSRRRQQGCRGQRVGCPSQPGSAPTTPIRRRNPGLFLVPAGDGYNSTVVLTDNLSIKSYSTAVILPDYWARVRSASTLVNVGRHGRCVQRSFADVRSTGRSGRTVEPALQRRLQIDDGERSLSRGQRLQGVPWTDQAGYVFTSTADRTRSRSTSVTLSPAVDAFRTNSAMGVLLLSDSQGRQMVTKAKSDRYQGDGDGN